MKCPACQQELTIPNHALAYADTYAEPSVVRAECCGVGLEVRPVRHYRVELYTGKRTEDDWGAVLGPSG